MRQNSRFKRPFLCLMFGIAAASVGITGCGGGGGSNGITRAGKWGGAQNGTPSNTVFPATLQLSATGGQITIACQGPARFNQPLVLDSNGHFSVTGTSVPCCILATVPTRFEGTVQGNTMTLTLVNTNNNTTIGTYTLYFGQDAPAQNVFCPG